MDFIIPEYDMMMPLSKGANNRYRRTCTCNISVSSRSDDASSSKDMSDAYKKYLDLVYRYLTIRNRSEKEIRDYLTKKKLESASIEQIILLLKQQKFLNDETFARAWVIQRARYRPKGKQVLRMELRQKGIPEDIIQQVLAEKHEDVPDELEQAKQLLKNRIKKVVGLPRHAVYQKLGAFLGRRGFTWEISKKAIDETLVQEKDKEA